jgi:hypothetical protein
MLHLEATTLTPMEMNTGTIPLLIKTNLRIVKHIQK